MSEQPSRGKVGFVVGTGRCGTKFFSQLAALEPLVASSHERNAYNASFHRYCKWYDLPVDSEGFLAAKQAEIAGDLAVKSYSLEASGYLSYSIKELYERFDAKFLLLVRRPDKVINSFHLKGWYLEPYKCADHRLAPGYQHAEAEWFNHFLARIAPRGDEFRAWNSLTRVGKLAWYWKTSNETTLRQFGEIPEANSMVVKLEELDYARYRDIAEFFGYRPEVSQQQFSSLSASRPNRIGVTRNVDDWSDLEYREFASEIGSLAVEMGYPVEREDLTSGQPKQAPAVSGGSARKMGDALVKLLKFGARGSNYLAYRLEKWLD